MDKPKKIVLNQEDFKELVAGRVVKKNGVEIILMDIGFNVMLDIVTEQVLKS